MKNLGMAYLGVSAGILLDMLEIICFGATQINAMAGEALSTAISGIGFIFFFVWTAVIGGGIKAFKSKGLRKKFLVTALIGIIPILGNIMPEKTIYAVSVSMRGDDNAKVLIIPDDAEDDEEQDDEKSEEEVQQVENEPQQQEEETSQEN